MAEMEGMVDRELKVSNAIECTTVCTSTILSQ